MLIEISSRVFECTKATPENESTRFEEPKHACTTQCAEGVCMLPKADMQSAQIGLNKVRQHAHTHTHNAHTHAKPTHVHTHSCNYIFKEYEKPKNIFILTKGLFHIAN